MMPVALFFLLVASVATSASGRPVNPFAFDKVRIERHAVSTSMAKATFRRILTAALPSPQDSFDMNLIGLKGDAGSQWDQLLGKSERARMFHKIVGGSKVDQSRATGILRLEHLRHQSTTKAIIHAAVDNSVLEDGGTIHLYLSLPNSAALGNHTDITNIFVLQLVGSKDWVFCQEEENAFYHTSLRGKLDKCTTYNVEEMEHMECTRETLYPGDVLYLPKRVVHSARATDSGLSAHLTFGLSDHMCSEDSRKVFLPANNRALSDTCNSDEGGSSCNTGCTGSCDDSCDSGCNHSCDYGIASCDSSCDGRCDYSCDTLCNEGCDICPNMPTSPTVPLPTAAPAVSDSPSLAPSQKTPLPTGAPTVAPTWPPTTMPTTRTPTSKPIAPTMMEPTTAAPTATFILPFLVCRVKLHGRDSNNDGLMSQTEFLFFVNGLPFTDEHYPSFESLPSSVQAVYNSYALADTGQIDIFGTGLLEQATQDKLDTLEQFCFDTQMAWAQSEAGATTAAPSFPPTTTQPTSSASALPTAPPTQVPTKQPTLHPSMSPSAPPTSSSPSLSPTSPPTTAPTNKPSMSPSPPLTSPPTTLPTLQPTSRQPTSSPSPTVVPTKQPMFTSSPQTSPPTTFPTKQPSLSPSTLPTFPFTEQPTKKPSSSPSPPPISPLTEPPTKKPTSSPSPLPISHPSALPSAFPSVSSHPTILRIGSNIFAPTNNPHESPGNLGQPPSKESTTKSPSRHPSSWPSTLLTSNPTHDPTTDPSIVPTQVPSRPPMPHSAQTPSVTPVGLPSLEATIPSNGSSAVAFELAAMGEVCSGDNDCETGACHWTKTSVSNTGSSGGCVCNQVTHAGCANGTHCAVVAHDHKNNSSFPACRVSNGHECTRDSQCHSNRCVFGDNQAQERHNIFDHRTFEGVCGPGPVTATAEPGPTEAPGTTTLNGSVNQDTPFSCSHNSLLFGQVAVLSALIIALGMIF